MHVLRLLFLLFEVSNRACFECQIGQQLLQLVVVLRGVDGVFFQAKFRDLPFKRGRWFTGTSVTEKPR